MDNKLAVCSSPWCKATFSYTDSDMVGNEDVKSPPKNCPKCISFDNELSGGVTWLDKEYEGSRFDVMPHEMKYKVTNFRL